MLSVNSAQKHLPDRAMIIEVLAYCSQHIALIENDILFIAQARARLGTVHPRKHQAWKRSGRLFQEHGLI